MKKLMLSLALLASAGLFSTMQAGMRDHNGDYPVEMDTDTEEESIETTEEEDMPEESLSESTETMGEWNHK